MKVVCVNDKVKRGFINKTVEKCESLTEGNVYEATPIALVSNVFNSTTIDISNYCFLIFDDEGNWSTHSMERFKPV